MKQIAVFLIGFIFLCAGCNSNPGNKDAKTEVLKIQKDMQANQNLIKKLNMPNQNIMQPPPPPAIKNMPVPPPAKTFNSPKTQSQPRLTKKPGGQLP
jgi:hypothetical protein